MRIRDANILRKKLADHLEWIRGNGGGKSALAQCIEVIVNAIDDIPEETVVPLEQYEALKQRAAELRNQLSAVSSSPFDGGMTQAQYFSGEARKMGAYSFETHSLWFQAHLEMHKLRRLHRNRRASTTFGTYLLYLRRVHGLGCFE